MPGSSPVPPGLGCFADTSVPPCLLKVQHSTSTNTDFEDMLYLRGGGGKAKSAMYCSIIPHFFHQNILHRYGYLLQEVLRSCHSFCQAGPIPKKAVIWQGQHAQLLPLLHLLVPHNFCLALQVHTKIIHVL